MKLEIKLVNVCKIYLSAILFLASFNLSAQKEIEYTVNYKCDTLTNSGKMVKIKVGSLECFEGPKQDQVLFFTNKEEFKEYLHKNKTSIGHCINKPEMTLDFKKYDVVLIRIGIGGCELPPYSLRVYENQQLNRYEINLNFIISNQVCATKHIFTRYLLLPKTKFDIPEFRIYETFNKCY